MRQHVSYGKAEVFKGALNFSYLLDAPAGKHGFVQVRNGHLYFEDGLRARFLGFNIATRSNTPDHEFADRLADHFASLGVNIIRLHAADAPISDEPDTWSSCRETPLIDYEKGSSRTFNKEGLDRFDYLVSALEKRGIYLHIDLLVARDFVEGDELDYPGGFRSCTKRYPIYNERLYELQQEYAKALLTHVNPYTGRALVDDPAVVTVQMTNEESAMKGTDVNDALTPYVQEVQDRFNHFLLSKYGDRAHLAAAWTSEGICALGEDEDPTAGTIRVIAGSFVQPVNDPTGDWVAPEGPARYADFCEFGIETNRRFYRRYRDYLIELGVRVPIVASNLLGGAADVYGHSDGDIMENNSYFNHPLLPVQNDTYLVVGPTEYVSTNPLTIQQGIGAMATTIPGLASVAAVEGKPFIISEWNEYGLHPFHSTAYVQTVAYACLNDWDGLILYNHHTSEKENDQPDDEIRSVFDSFNDPALITEWGFMAAMFLKGLVRPMDQKVDVVFTQNDLLTLPKFSMLPNMTLTYITGMRNVFLDGGEQYQGDADVAVNAGYTDTGDLSCAEHSIWWSWNQYRDAYRRSCNAKRLERAAAGGTSIGENISLSDRALVFRDIQSAIGIGDYRGAAETMTKALTSWGVIPEGTGYVDGKIISGTGEIVFDPDHSRFAVTTPSCAYYSGAPEEEIQLGSNVTVKSKNDRITLALLPLDGCRDHAAEAYLNGQAAAADLDSAADYVLTAIGTTGMDGTTMGEGPQLMGIPFTAVHFDGKLFAETLEGSLSVAAAHASLELLDTEGNVISTLHADGIDGVATFDLDGAQAGVQYLLHIA